MKTDIEIAQEATMEPIKNVAANYGILEDELELYGKYKAKLSDELWDRIKTVRTANWYWLPPSIRLRQEKERPLRP